MAVEPNRIDYRKLAAALEYYEPKGYAYLEVPWVVSREATTVTLPKDRHVTTSRIGDLVGSAEQSFIELLLRGETITKACAITPCFRDEEVYDDLHHAYFMKLELINTDATLENLHAMITDAIGFLNQYLDVEIEETGENMFDIVSTKGRIELGSYGFRDAPFGRFIYGTGLALPRLDTACNR